MSATVILEAKVKPGHKTDLLKLLTKHLPDTHKFQGFVDISIYSEVDTDLVIFISKWDSFEIYQQYLQWRTDSGVMAALGALLAAPPVIRQLTQEISESLELIYN